MLARSLNPTLELQEELGIFPFQQRFPWFGGDLQTLRDTFVDEKFLLDKDIKIYLYISPWGRFRPHEAPLRGRDGKACAIAGGTPIGGGADPASAARPLCGRRTYGQRAHPNSRPKPAPGLPPFETLDRCRPARAYPSSPQCRCS